MLHDFKIGDRVKIIQEKCEKNKYNWGVLKSYYPNLIAKIISIDERTVEIEGINSFNHWIDYNLLEKINNWEPLPESQKEPVFIPSCSDCKSKHYSAMDESKPCYECYGGENSNFVFMG